MNAQESFLKRIREDSDESLARMAHETQQFADRLQRHAAAQQRIADACRKELKRRKRQGE